MGYLQRCNENDFRLRAYRGLVNGRRKYESRRFQGSPEEAQRALDSFQSEPSTAELTPLRQQFVYAIAPLNDDPPVVKIGRAVNVMQRLKNLSACSPIPLRLIGKWLPRSYFATEAHLHYRYRSQRLHGEWFQLNNELQAEIEKWRER